MTASEQKPSIEEMSSYLLSQIPGCAISDREKAELKTLLPKVTRKDLNRVFHQAIKEKAMQPFSYMLRQLRVIKPTSDPFNTQIGGRRSFNTRVNENGTNWDAVYAEKAAELEQEKAAYDRKYGAGAWKKKDDADWDHIFKMFAELERDKSKNDT